MTLPLRLVSVVHDTGLENPIRSYGLGRSRTDLPSYIGLLRASPLAFSCLIRPILTRPVAIAVAKFGLQPHDFILDDRYNATGAGCRTLGYQTCARTPRPPVQQVRS